MNKSIALLMLFPLLLWADINSNYAVAPELIGPVMQSSEDNDLFAESPRYYISNNRQALLHNDWTGEQDFTATMRVCWTKDGIFFRFDIADDLPVSGNDGKTGDRISLDLQHLSCGPSRESRNAFRITMMPNVRDMNCPVKLTNTQALAGKLGAVKARLFVNRDNSYTVLLHLPHANWDDSPRSGGLTRMRVTYYDADEKLEGDHVFSLFAPRGTQRSTTGTIIFAGRFWAKLNSPEVVYGDHVAGFQLDMGNLTDRAMEAQLSITPTKVANPPPSAVLNNYAKKVAIPVDAATQGVDASVDFTGLPSGVYTVKAKAGVFYDSGAIQVGYDANSGLIYMPGLIDRRRKTAPRKLAILRDRFAAKRTFQYMAGGGKVLWSAGIYDGRSNELPEVLRTTGEQELAIPGGKESGIPWARFGGRDTLDNMSEPLLLKIDEAFGKHEARLAPENSLLDNFKISRQRNTMPFTRLLLVGVIAEHHPDRFPEIHITTRGLDDDGNTQDTTLLRQVLKPNPDSKNRKHSYVFRVWLTANDTEIRIENPASKGTYFEFDFLALMAGGTPTSFGFDEPHLVFHGTHEAERLNRILATSMYFTKNYLIDSDGLVHSSLPGGRYAGNPAYDHAVLLNEMAHWGAMDVANNMVNRAAPYLASMRPGFGNSRLNIAHPLMVSGVYQVWRRNGKREDNIGPFWDAAIARPVTEMLNQSESHPLGLINSTGEFGVRGDDLLGATSPMHHATSAAIESAITLARDREQGLVANEWARKLAEFQKNYNRLLVSSPSGTSINSQRHYPASYSIPETFSIATNVPTKTLLYGWFENKTPICYNDGIRVFDTPYLFSGLAHTIDSSGFLISPDTALHIRNAFEHLFNTSPVYATESWQHHYVTDYKSTEMQLWTILASLLIEDRVIATKALNGLIRYTYDEAVDIPLGSDIRSDIEISPYTLEEKINVGQGGRNSGGTYDDINPRIAALGFKVARLIVGIDDHDFKNLILAPRLPEDWDKVDANNWLVSHQFENSNANTLDFYSYEKLGDERYSLVLNAPEKLSSVTVRVGPFSPNVRKVRLTNAGFRVDVKTERAANGLSAWALHTFENVRSLDIVSQPIHR